MSARRTTSSSGIYPNLYEEDVLLGGRVCCYRCVEGRSFSEENTLCFARNWHSLAELPRVIQQTMDDEKVGMAEKHAAWDPEFGYLSPNPECCGHNIYIENLAHLEALNLLGDLQPVLAGLDALRFEAMGFEKDGIRDTAHIFHVRNGSAFGISYNALIDRITRVFTDLAQQELFARRQLVKEHKRLFADSISRALAVLRAARLLTPWEVADILSPIRMATSMGFIDGITKEEIDNFTLQQIYEQPDYDDTPSAIRARDRRDAALADRMNRRFVDVALNAHGRKTLKV